MQHGKHWTGTNPRGWIASEKFRGARAYWDGAHLWSRGGLRISIPPAWRADLPRGFPLDGEVWAGYGPAGGECEVEAAQAVTHSRFTARLCFLVFDAPSVLAPWQARLSSATAMLRGATIARSIEASVVANMRHLEQLWGAVARRGGEGLMLRSPQAPACYEPGRVAHLRKVKHDPALLRGVVRFAA